LAADLGKGGEKYALAFVIYRFAYNIPSRCELAEKGNIHNRTTTAPSQFCSSGE
jgi:hypothetical protein